jgi:hypothetical protein
MKYQLLNSWELFVWAMECDGFSTERNRRACLCVMELSQLYPLSVLTQREQAGPRKQSSSWFRAPSRPMTKFFNKKFWEESKSQLTLGLAVYLPSVSSWRQPLEAHDPIFFSTEPSDNRMGLFRMNMLGLFFKLIAYFPFMRHRPHWKWHIHDFF